MSEWCDEYERRVTNDIGALRVDASANAWDRSVGRAQGMLLVLRLLKRLNEDAKLYMEKVSKENA